MKLSRVYVYPRRMIDILLKRHGKDPVCGKCQHDLGDPAFILRGEGFQPYCSESCALMRWMDLQEGDEKSQEGS